MNKINTIRVMNLTVKEYPVMTGNTVFSYDYRQFVTLMQEPD